MRKKLHQVTINEHSNNRNTPKSYCILCHRRLDDSIMHDLQTLRLSMAKSTLSNDVQREPKRPAPEIPSMQEEREAIQRNTRKRPNPGTRTKNIDITIFSSLSGASVCRILFLDTLRAVLWSCRPRWLQRSLVKLRAPVASIHF